MCNPERDYAALLANHFALGEGEECGAGASDDEGCGAASTAAGDLQRGGGSEVSGGG